VVTHLQGTVKGRVAVLEEEPAWAALGETTTTRGRMQGTARRGLWTG
jgi:hypothetical protein